MSTEQVSRRNRVPGTFRDACKDAYVLVNHFLNDSQPWGRCSSDKSDFEYNDDLRGAVKEKVKKSLEVLECAIDRHGLEEIAISYNGGKDCLVMLILILATIYKMKYISSGSPDGPTGVESKFDDNYKLDAIYINSEVPFPQVSEFIANSTLQYHLNAVVIKDSLKEGFDTYLKAKPEIKAIIVGIRRSDPYGSTLEYEQVTDHNWPKFLRIHPILHWDYVHIWDFLIGCDLDYCQMYDLGYTSIGGINNTVPNPYLQNGNSYRPAYTLREDADNRERLGRTK
ncbi:flavin adenine dinucleotide synthase [[Candida] anglica]|uniref:FAD synthase n=1 Tax=[Candida] anglica TaxID=148631 RepID=A0ABP0ECZ0_9ASCO